MGAVNTGQTFGSDITAPEWTTDFPKLLNVLDTQGDLHVSLDEPGTVYYVVLPDGADAPTSEQVKAGVDYGTVTVYVAGSVDVAEAGTEYIETIKGATPETSYDIYVVAEDLAATPNLQASPELFNVTMTPARGLTIVSPQPNDTYYVGTEVTFQWTSANITNVMIGGYDYDNDDYFFLTPEGSDDPYVIDATLGEFKFTIPNDAGTELIDIRIFDAADTTFFSKVYPVNLVDDVKPSITELWPVAGASKVPTITTLTAYFDEDVFPGTGNITISKLNDGVFETFDIATAGPGADVTIDGNILTIRPTKAFANSTDYYVEMDAGVVKDWKDNAFDGISGSSTWFFTTEPTLMQYYDFNTGTLDPWTSFSVSGASKEWKASDDAAYMNGYNSGELEEDWLISPAMPTAGNQGLSVSFSLKYDYGNYSNDADNYLKLYYSTDYDGNTANLASATWTEISMDYPPFSNVTWYNGDLDVGVTTDQDIYFAFKYHYNPGEYRSWWVDNFELRGIFPPGSDATLSELYVDGVALEGFSPAVEDYTMVLPAGTTTIPVITFNTTDPAASGQVVIVNATDLSGTDAQRTTTITVTATDQQTTKTYTIRFDPILEVANLAALRAVTDYERVYTVTGEAVVTAIVSFNNQKFLQDATAGIQVFDADGVITTTYAEGDGITGLTGTLLDYYGQLELIPYADPGAASSTGNTVNPQTITIPEFNTNFEDYESELVEIDGVSFTDANGTATFANGSNYDMTDGTNTAILRVHFYNTTVTGAVIPSVADVRGIAIYHYDEYKISPRYIEDITDVSSVKDLLSAQLKLYPTPVTDVLYLENIPQVDYLEVMNVTGTRVMTRSLNGAKNYELDVTGLPHGIYFIRLHAGDESLTRKFVKK